MDSETREIPEETTQTNGSNGHKIERTSKFPLSRVRKIMKTDPDITLANHEAVYVISKATELFLELFTKEAYEYTARNKKKTVKKTDIESSVEARDSFAFLEGVFDS